MIRGCAELIKAWHDGITHAFIVEFLSRMEFDVYVTHSAHVTFRAYVREMVVKAQVIDYVEGDFSS
jgi:hypothetical protein